MAVLTRTPAQAERAYHSLLRSHIPGLTRVFDQEFSFEAGIEVTEAAQTKGLEFDYVVLLDVDSKTYNDSPASRHLLHVGMTRAMHQLWLLTWASPSPLLPEWLTPRVAG